MDPLIKEKNLHREQFIHCRKKLSASNDLVKELENELVKELKFSLDDRNDLNNTINDFITCQICYEQFQSNGERIPCKLKCPHIICKKCAVGWITTGGWITTCGTLVSVYRFAI